MFECKPYCFVYNDRCYDDNETCCDYNTYCFDDKELCCQNDKGRLQNSQGCIDDKEVNIDWLNVIVALQGSLF